jgi:hypothetical protein
MSTTFTGIPQATPPIPKLNVQVDNFHSQTTIANLAHNYPSADPTNDGLYDWKNPELTLFTRDITPEILAMNPVVVLRRWKTQSNNYHKPHKSRNAKRWVTPGNSANNGLNFHGGLSNTTRGGEIIPEIDNFTVINNPGIVGYNHVYFNNYKLPMNRFVKYPPAGGNYGDFINQAIYIEDFMNNIRYSGIAKMPNLAMKFELSLAVPNPNWTSTNHQNKWIFGEGQVVIVEPKLQTFDDGSGTLEYFVGWMARVVN